MYTPPATCDGAGMCKPVTPFNCPGNLTCDTTANDLQGDLHHQRRLRVAHRLQQRQLLAEAERNDVLGRVRVLVQPLPAGRLLRDHLHGHVHVVRGGRQRRDLQAGHGGSGAEPDHPVRHLRRVDLRHQRPV